MKKILCATLAGLFLASQAVTANAASVAFTVSATVNKVSNVSISAVSVLSSDNTKRTTVMNNQLTMDPMTYNASLDCYLPDHFYVIDSSVTGASMTVSMVYAEGAIPNGASGHNLGWKTAATFKKVVINPTTLKEEELNISGHGDANGKKLLKDMIATPESFTTAQTAGGWLRTYIGINYRYDPTLVTGGEFFTNADAGGTYSGTLTVTATAV